MKTILIVEDERNLNEAYQFILKKHGYEVKTAYNGVEALEFVSKQDPDLILLDLRMPIMDGLEFLRKYDKSKEHPDVKVVVFSNLDSKEDIAEAYELGADKYMLKAWSSPKELAALVEDIFSEASTNADKS